AMANSAPEVTAKKNLTRPANAFGLAVIELAIAVMPSAIMPMSPESCGVTAFRMAANAVATLWTAPVTAGWSKAMMNASANVLKGPAMVLIALLIGSTQWLSTACATPPIETSTLWNGLLTAF